MGRVRLFARETKNSTGATLPCGSAHVHFVVRETGPVVTLNEDNRSLHPMSYLRRRVLSVAALTVLALMVLIGPRFLGVHTVPVPRGPKTPLRVEDFAEVLDSNVSPRGIDYERLYAHRDPLLRFVQALAEFGPKSAPDAFPSEADRFVYYINAYNALTLYGVLVHQPRTSIHEVRGVFEPTPGFGFFWAQNFRLDGESINLYNLENSILRDFDDARLHAAINCASTSCPPLRAQPFRAATLESDLEEAARSWVSNHKHVQVTAEAIELSSIFDWFSSDFESHAQRLGVGSTTLDWVAHYLPQPRRDALRSAEAAGLPIRYRPYDWTLNRAAASTSTASEGRGVGS